MWASFLPGAEGSQNEPARPHASRHVVEHMRAMSETIYNSTAKQLWAELDIMHGLSMRGAGDFFIGQEQSSFNFCGIKGTLTVIDQTFNTPVMFF